jgi:hypothetical protein
MWKSVVWMKMDSFRFVDLDCELSFSCFRAHGIYWVATSYMLLFDGTLRGLAAETVRTWS